MQYVCNRLIQNVCVEWAEYKPASWVDMLAINKQEMLMMSSAIFSIYIIVIAFIAFNNFVKRA